MNREERERMGGLELKKPVILDVQAYESTPDPSAKFLAHMVGAGDLYWWHPSSYTHGLIMCQYTNQPGKYGYQYCPERFGSEAKYRYQIAATKHSWYKPSLRLAREKKFYTGTFG